MSVLRMKRPRGWARALSDDDYMRLALNSARQGVVKGQTPFGCCIVRRGEIIARAHNAVWHDIDCTAHAEMRAIRRACRGLGTIVLRGCTVYTTCEPCPMCFSACHWARVRRIVFGARISDARLAGFRELRIGAQRMKRLGGSDLTVSGGVLRAEAVALLREWSRGKQSRAY